MPVTIEIQTQSPHTGARDTSAGDVIGEFDGQGSRASTPLFDQLIRAQ